MKYVVVWPHFLKNQLTESYNSSRAAGHAAAFTAATARLDVLLRTNLESLGESREADKRFLVEMPVAIDFESHEEEGVVLVLNVRYVSRKG